MAHPLRGFLVLAIGLTLGCDQDLAHEPVPGPRCALTIELVDAETHEPVGGVIRLRRVGADAEHSPVDISELINRGFGVEPPGPIGSWWVLPAKSTISGSTSDQSRPPTPVARRGRAMLLISARTSS